MDCLSPVPLVGPHRRRGTLFNLLSVTELMVELVSPQPTTTMFVFPAVCAAGYVTATVVFDAWIVAGSELDCTNAMVAPPPLVVYVYPLFKVPL